jgi:hypothetical protein
VTNSFFHFLPFEEKLLLCIKIFSNYEAVGWSGWEDDNVAEKLLAFEESNENSVIVFIRS